MNEELQKEELSKKELNETEKDLQLPLKDAGVDEIGEKLLKEIEDADKTENFMHQNEVQAWKSATGFISNTNDTISSFNKNLEPYLLHFKIIIKGFKHNEALRVVNLKRRSDEKGKIRFDKEKYFSDCYSFKVKLDESKAYFPTPLQNAKRIFNNYTHHKVGLILKFKAKDHLVYDGFNVYHYKGNELINSYMARSGTAKADNQKRSKKQIAHYFYQDEKDKSKSGKAYFYYDDESIQDRFGTLPEGEYYLKINEIAKDTKPSFLKDYPFEIGKTWGRYCVRLYTDKECSKTFKEIEIKESDKTLNWSYVECNSEKKMRYLLDTDCHSIEAKDLKFIDSFKGNICGFHLPISRDNEPIKDTKDYKYYIIVFAYDEKKVMPSLEDFHIVIDMSFRVGVGRDESVEEGKLRNDFNSDIIQTNCIFSVFEAVEFLKACQSLKEEKNEIDNYVFFKNYPQLAGKIAYIYYRFDLANEEFIKSVSDGNKYLKEREKFYKVASDVYIKNPIYKMGFEKKLQNQVVDINIVKDFLKDFAKRLGIDEKVLPVIGYNPQRGDSGTYDYTVNTLDLNPKASCVDFIDTIIHEFRHFYIYCIKNNSENSIEKLLYLDMVQFYISWNFYKIFNSYDKKCLIYDNEDETKKCLKNRTYYGSWKFLNPKLDLLPSPLYYLQPSELDSRIMAYYFRKEIKL